MRRLVPIYPLLLVTLVMLFVVASTMTAVVIVVEGQQQLSKPSGTDGGLSVTINKSSFNAGESVAINGTVADYTNPSVVKVQVRDPHGRQVENEDSLVYVLDGKNQFRFTFQAGSVRQFDPDHWMKLSGYYNVTVTYQPPSLVTPEIERVNLSFNYSNATNTNATDGAAATSATETDTTTISDTTATSVSIVPVSSTLTIDAFSPNPVQVSVGTTVTWTNDDAQPHTVNSGESPTPTGLFDSPIMAPQATFEYTFTEAGEYPYFCILHPNMVGTVSVVG